MSKSTMLQDAPASREQLREQIRQTVKEAQAAAKAAAEEAAQGRDVGPRVIIGPPGALGTGTGTPMILPPELPRGVENISIAFFVMVAAVIVGLPLMRAIARRIDKGTSAAAQIPTEVRQQLQQISQNVDAIAIEVERISEGQRFTTKMLADRTRDGTVVTPGSSSAP
jgi:hypothetical protein